MRLVPRESTVADRRGRRTPLSRRRAQALLLVALPLVLSSCVYLRLLELKRQLAEFDRHFVVDAGDGLKLIFRTPVLLDRDVEFLGLSPASRRKEQQEERWHFRWIKDPVPADRGEIFEQNADFRFDKGKLVEVYIPERFFAFFPKEAMVTGLRSMGSATVDRKQRRATTEVRDTPGGGPPLQRAELVRMLGAPTAVEGTTNAPAWRYTFRPASQDQKSGPLDVTFFLDPASGVVRGIRGRMIRGSFELLYPQSK